ncbi:MAG: winged helix-turn-helix transcriptional regulator [Treponema sp.]
MSVYVSNICSTSTYIFGKLCRSIGEINESSLTKLLRKLEADGFLLRYDYKEILPCVEYSLTEIGKSFMKILKSMQKLREESLLN